MTITKQANSHRLGFYIAKRNDSSEKASPSTVLNADRKERAGPGMKMSKFL
jgi:hypothetical protein